MKKLTLLVFIVLQVFLSNSCSPEVVDGDTYSSNLELTITDEKGKAVKDAKVSFFLTKEDFDSKTHPVHGTLYSDKTGKVIAENLTAKKYYWFIEKECKSNKDGVFTTDSDLKPNSAEKKTIVISEKTNDIDIANTTNEALLVNINGGSFFVVEAKQLKTLSGYSLGKYIITWKSQVEGSEIKSLSTEMKYCGLGAFVPLF